MEECISENNDANSIILARNLNLIILARPIYYGFSKICARDIHQYFNYLEFTRMH